MTLTEARYVWENRGKGWWTNETVDEARRVLEHAGEL